MVFKFHYCTLLVSLLYSVCFVMHMYNYYLRIWIAAEREGSTVSIQPMNSGANHLSEQSAKTSDEVLAMPAKYTGSGSFVSKWYFI